MLSLALAGCAQIESRSDVQIIRTPGTASVPFGPRGGKRTARGASVQWTQVGTAITFDVVATHECTPLRREPVQRVETITRTTGGALYWEFGIGGVLLAAGLTGLLAPQLFGQSIEDADGEVVRDTRAGYRVGGIFTGLSAVALGAGIYDTVRSRDEVLTTDSHITHRDEPAPCAKPQTPVAGRTMEITVGNWHSTAQTDERGRVRFSLPPPPDGTEPVEPVELDPMRVPSVADPVVTPEPKVVDGVLRLGGRHALPFDFVAPYSAPDAQSHRGRASLGPIPLQRVPPQPRPAGGP